MEKKYNRLSYTRKFDFICFLLGLFVMFLLSRTHLIFIVLGLAGTLVFSVIIWKDDSSYWKKRYYLRW